MPRKNKDGTISSRGGIEVVKIKNAEDEQASPSIPDYRMRKRRRPPAPLEETPEPYPIEGWISPKVELNRVWRKRFFSGTEEALELQALIGCLMVEVINILADVERLQHWGMIWYRFKKLKKAALAFLAEDFDALRQALAHLPKPVPPERVPRKSKSGVDEEDPDDGQPNSGDC